MNSMIICWNASAFFFCLTDCHSCSNRYSWYFTSIRNAGVLYLDGCVKLWYNTQSWQLTASNNNIGLVADSMANIRHRMSEFMHIHFNSIRIRCAFIAITYTYMVVTSGKQKYPQSQTEIPHTHFSHTHTHRDSAFELSQRNVSNSFISSCATLGFMFAPLRALAVPNGVMTSITMIVDRQNFYTHSTQFSIKHKVYYIVRIIGRFIGISILLLCCQQRNSFFVPV